MTIGERIAKKAAGKTVDAAAACRRDGVEYPIHQGLGKRCNEACVKYHHQALLIARCFF